MIKSRCPGKESRERKDPPELKARMINRVRGFLTVQLPVTVAR